MHSFNYNVHLESSQNGIITQQCNDKNLSINFWKLEFNGYLMVYFLLEKDLAFTCSACLKLVEVNILAEILSKILEKKKRRKIGDLICNHDLTN